MDDEMDDEDLPRQKAPLDPDTEEEWVRFTKERDVRGVEASKCRGADEWQWSVTIWAAQYVREGVDERVMQRTITRALRAVPGVRRAEQDDREVWVVDGTPSGEALVKGAADAIDKLAALIRQHIKSQKTRA